MLIKINKKPIPIETETKEPSSFNPVKLCVSTIGYFLILYLMDYISYIFFFKHIFPIIHTIGSFIGGLF